MIYFVAIVDEERFFFFLSVNRNLKFLLRSKDFQWNVKNRCGTN